MTHLKTNAAKICLVMLCGWLSSCSTSHFTTVVSGYGLTKQEGKQEAQNVGYSKGQWLIWPLLRLDGQTTIKIHPAAWQSLNLQRSFCPAQNSQFYLMLWSKDTLQIDLSNSFFIDNKGKKIAIESIKSVGSQNALDTTALTINASQYSAATLERLWLEDDYKQFIKQPGRHHLEVTTQSQVGCAADYYQFNLALKNRTTGVVSNTLFYFHPVQFQSFSR